VRSGYWQDLTTADFGRVDPERTVGLLPVAAVEQHGPHLPLGVDALINEALVRAALERVPDGATLLVLPAQNVGLSPEHTSFAGTLSIRDTTLLDAWTDIGRSMGVTKQAVQKRFVPKEPAQDFTRFTPRARKTISRAIEKGVKVACGTDAPARGAPAFG